MSVTNLPLTIPAPTWDVGKNKWKWVVTPDYTALHATSGPYDYGWTQLSLSATGDGLTGFEYSPGSMSVAGPYTFWLNPINESRPHVEARIKVFASNGAGGQWESNESTLLSSCIETRITFGEPVWNVATSKFDIVATATPYGSAGPYTYSWGGSDTASTKTYSLNRSETVSASCIITTSANGGCFDSGMADYTAPASCITDIDIITASNYYDDGRWYCTIWATPVGGSAPYIYSWSGVVATAGGSSTDSTITFRIDPSDGDIVYLSVSDSTPFTPCTANRTIPIVPPGLTETVPTGWYCVQSGASSSGCVFVEPFNTGLPGGTKAGPFSSFGSCMSNCTSSSSGGTGAGTGTGSGGGTGTGSGVGTGSSSGTGTGTGTGSGSSSGSGTGTGSGSSSGAVGSPCIVEGGYSDFSLSAPDGETWFDNQTDGATIFTVAGNYLTVKNFGFIRGAVGLSWSASLGAVLSNISANNCTSAIVVNNAVLPDFKITSINNCSTGFNCLISSGEVLIDQAANNAGYGLNLCERTNYRPWNRSYINLRNNGVANTTTGTISITGSGSFLYNADLTNNTTIALWNSFRGFDNTLVNCKISYSTVFSRASTINLKGKLSVPDYNQTVGDHRIYTGQLVSYARSGSDAYACSELLVANAPSTFPAELKIMEVGAVAGRPITLSIDVKRTTTASSANFVLKNDYENMLATSATTSAANNTYETISVNYTPTRTGILRLYWYCWTTASSGINEVTIKNLKATGIASSLAFKNFGLFNAALPVTPNASSGVSAQIGSAFIPLFEIPMQAIKLGQTAYFEFPVQDSAGAAATPDAVSVKFRRNNTQDVAVTPTITTGAGFGLGSVVVPSGYALGDQLSVEIQATVGGITGAWTPVWRGKVTDVANEVWGAGTRTLSGFGFTVNTNANATETAIKAKTDLIGDSVATAADLHVTVNGGYTTGDRTRDDQTNDLIVERLTLPDYPDGPVLVLPAPSTPENTIIYGYTRDFGQASVAGVTVKLKHITKKIAVGNGFPVEYEAETQSDEDGFWSLECPISSDIKPATAGATQSLTIGEVTYNIRVPVGGGNAVEMIR